MKRSELTMSKRNYGFVNNYNVQNGRSYGTGNFTLSGSATEADHTNIGRPVDQYENDYWQLGAHQAIHNGIRPTGGWDTNGDRPINARDITTDRDYSWVDESRYRTTGIRAMPDSSRGARIDLVGNQTAPAELAEPVRVFKAYDWIFDAKLEPSAEGNPKQTELAQRDRDYRFLSGNDQFFLKTEDKDDTPLFNPMTRIQPWAYDKSIDANNLRASLLDEALKNQSDKGRRLLLPSKRDYNAESGSYWRNDTVTDENGLPYRPSEKTYDEIKSGQTRVGGAIGRAPNMSGPALNAQTFWGDTRADRIKRMIIFRPGPNSFDPHRSYQHTISPELMKRSLKNVVNVDQNMDTFIPREGFDELHVSFYDVPIRKYDPTNSRSQTMPSFKKTTAGSEQDWQAQMPEDHRLDVRSRARNKIHGFGNWFQERAATVAGFDGGKNEYKPDQFMKKTIKKSVYGWNKRPGHFEPVHDMSGIYRARSHGVKKTLKKRVYDDAEQISIPRMGHRAGQLTDSLGTLERRNPTHGQYNYMVRHDAPEYDGIINDQDRNSTRIRKKGHDKWIWRDQPGMALTNRASVHNLRNNGTAEEQGIMLDQIQDEHVRAGQNRKAIRFGPADNNDGFANYRTDRVSPKYGQVMTESAGLNAKYTKNIFAREGMSTNINEDRPNRSHGVLAAAGYESKYGRDSVGTARANKSKRGKRSKKSRRDYFG